MPSSSTHALVGGLLGAGAASAFLGTGGLAAPDGVLVQLVFLPLLLSPVLAFVLAWLAVYAATWLVRFRTQREVHRDTRVVEAVLAGTFSLGHGLQDGQRTVSVVLLALGAAGLAAGTASVPLWVQLFAAVLLAAGTLCGGWRISHTLGSPLVPVGPVPGGPPPGVRSALLFPGGLSPHNPPS